MMKDRVFGHGTTMSMLGSPDSFRIAKSKKERVKEKVKAIVDSKEQEEHAFVKNKHKTLNGGQKKTVFGGPRVRKARKALRRVRTTSLKVILVSFIKKKVQIMKFTPVRAEATIRKKGKEGACPQPQKHKVKKDMAMPGNLMTGISHGMARDVLHGWHQFL